MGCRIRGGPGQVWWWATHHFPQPESWWAVSATNKKSPSKLIKGGNSSCHKQQLNHCQGTLWLCAATALWPSLCLPLISLLVVPRLVRWFLQFPSMMLGSPLGGEQWPRCPLPPREQHPDVGRIGACSSGSSFDSEMEKIKGKKAKEKKKSGTKMQREVLDKNPGSCNYCCIYLLIIY